MQVKGHGVASICGRYRFGKQNAEEKMVQWEVEVGPLKLNFRVLLEPKGFLRIIIAVSDRLPYHHNLHRVSWFFRAP